MLVYRIEKAGKGFYAAKEKFHQSHRQHSLYQRIRNRHGSDRLNCPTPNGKQMCMVWERTKTVFGFTSIKQYKNWFKNKKHRDDLKTLGFKLNVYNVPDNYVSADDYQCTFKRKHAKKLISVNPNEPKLKTIIEKKLAC